MTVTYDQILTTLTPSFGDDVAQEVIERALRLNLLVRANDIGYFIRMARNVRNEMWQRETQALRRAKRTVARVMQRSQPPAQLSRVLCKEAWDEAPAVVREAATHGTAQAARVLGLALSNAKIQVHRYRKEKRANA